MPKPIVPALLVVLAAASLGRAQPVFIGVSSSMYDGVSNGFSVGMTLDNFNGGFGYGIYGSTRLVSPGGVAGGWNPDNFGHWGGAASTREDIVAMMNGRWTLEFEDAFDGRRADYFFDVTLSGIDANDLAPVIITSPLPGSMISRTPTVFYESAFNLNSPDDGVGIIVETIDTARVNNGQCTFTRPLRDGIYTAGIQLFRDRLIDEVFTVRNAGASGLAYEGFNFSAGSLRLNTFALVSGLVVPSPSAAALLVLGGVAASRRRR